MQSLLPVVHIVIALRFWLQFPTVTVCNKNQWKRSIVTLNGTSQTMKSVLTDLYMEEELPPPENK